MALAKFIETKQYRRFAEFCNECMKSQYIGVCHGPAGVGKTLSARRYTHWDAVEALPQLLTYDVVVPEPLLEASAIYLCPGVLNGARVIARDVNTLRYRLGQIVMKSQENAKRLTEKLGPRSTSVEPKLAVERPAWWREDNPSVKGPRMVLDELAAMISGDDPTRLIVVDEADRLKIPAIEQLRSIYDQGGIGIVLIGMPGIEKRLSRYPQLYSRVGFAHEFAPLSQEEMSEILLEKLNLLDFGLPEGAIQDKEGVAAIIRSTGGNFRLMKVLLQQVRRILHANQLIVVTSEVVEAARESLVDGAA